LRTAITPFANEFGKWIGMSAIRKYRKKVVLMASRESHCLADLLHRWHQCVEWSAISQWLFSNHDDLRQYGRVARHSVSSCPVEIPQNKVARLLTKVAQTV